jgi:hypothetical protein
MGIFGLGSFGEGLVKGLAESATTSLQDEMERIEDSIKTASDIRLKRIVQDQDRRRDEAEKIVKALKRARANLGGADDQQAAIRAASLLKQSGDLDAFNTLVGRISDRAQGEDLDYNKYFGDVSKMSPAASDLDIAYSFIDDTTIPLPDSKEGLKGVEPKGLFKYLGPDIDAESLVEQRTQEQMTMMDLGVRDVKDISIPTVEFRREAFKLDGMTADQEYKYVRDRLAKGGLDDKQRTFYSERATNLASNLGIDKQMELAINDLNTATDAATKAKAEQTIMNLGKTQSRITAMKTGSTIEMLKLDKEEALEKGDLKAASAIDKKLLDAGAITLDSYLSRLQTTAASGGEGSEAARNEAVKIGTVIAKLKQDIGDASKRVTFDGIVSVQSKARKLAMAIVKDNPELLAAGMRFEVKSDGTYGIDEANTKSDAAVNEAFNKAFDAALNKVYADFASNKDSNSDVNFVAAYEAHKGGVEIKSVVSGGQKPKVTVNDTQINAIKARPDTAEGGAAYLAAAEQAAAKRNVPVNTDALVDAARQAGKSDEFINAIKPIMTPEVRSLVAQGADTEAAAFEAGMPEAISGAVIDKDVAKAEKIIENTSGFKSKEVRAIEKQMGVTKEKALELHEKVKQIIEERDAQKGKRSVYEYEGGVVPDVLFMGMGKTIPYKQVDGEYYRIKDDGTLAKEPANDARKAMLDDPDRKDVKRTGGSMEFASTLTRK